MIYTKKAIFLLVGFAMFLAASAVASASTPDFQTTYNIHTGQQICVWTAHYPDQQGHVYYYPHEKGTRTVSIWHNMYTDSYETGITQYYWIDKSKPNDTWHLFTTQSFGFLFPTKVKLYSGSNTIYYQFVVTNCDENNALPVQVKVY